MEFRSLLSKIRRFGCAALLGVLIPVNIAAYGTLWRKYHSEGVLIHPETNLLDVIKSAPGDSLEDKVHEVVYERISFKEVKTDRKFNDMLFSYLKENGCQVQGQHITLEDKISYAQMFSSTLDYNYKANLVSYLSDNKGWFVSKTIESVSEYVKINRMNPEQIMGYKNVVCVQYAKVFAAALDLINRSSSNPEDILIGQLYYVPDDTFDFGQPMNFILSSLNAASLFEWRSSLAHAKNVIVTDSKFYIIEPQEQANLCSYDSPVSFDNTVLDIDKKYVGKVR